MSLRGLLAALAVLALIAPGGAAAAPAGWSEIAARDLAGERTADCLRVAGPGAVALLGELTATTSATDVLGVAPATGPGGGPDTLVRRSATTLGWLSECAAVAPVPAAADDPAARAGALLAGAVRRLGRPGAGAGPVDTLRVAEAGGDAVTLRTAPGATIHGVKLAVAPGAEAPGADAPGTDAPAADAPAADAPGGNVPSGPSAATGSANGAAVVAWLETSVRSNAGRSRVLAAVRPRSGAPFSPPHVVAQRAARALAFDPAVAIDAAGRATVAWIEADAGRLEADSVVRLATATPDGRFGASRRLTTASGFGETLTLAAAGDGRTLIALNGNPGVEAFERVDPAGRFARVAVPGADELTATELAIAQGPDGAALIAGRAQDAATFAWRRPSGGPFGPVELVHGSYPSTVGGTEFSQLGGIAPPRPLAPDDPAGGRLSALLDPDGSATLTWIAGPSWASASTAQAVHGTLAGGFARPWQLGSPCRPANAVRPLRLASGRAAVAWTDHGDARGGGELQNPFAGPGETIGRRSGRLALAVPAPTGVAVSGAGASPSLAPAGAPVPAAGASPARAPTGAPVPAAGASPARAPTGAPVPAAGASPARAPTGAPVPAAGASPARAPTGAPVPAAGASPSGVRAPRVLARVVSPRALRLGQPLTLRVRCAGGAPCSVRGTATSRAHRRSGPSWARDWEREKLSATVAIPRGGARVLRFDPSPGFGIATLGRGTATVGLTACTPDGSAVRPSVLRTPVQGLPERPVLRLLDVRARRAGDAIRVTWRTSRPARDATFVAYAERLDYLQTAVALRGRGRSRLAAVLRGPGVARALRVTVSASTGERAFADEATVPVTVPRR